CTCSHRALHAFPTRRSSDLEGTLRQHLPGGDAAAASPRRGRCGSISREAEPCGSILPRSGALRQHSPRVGPCGSTFREAGPCGRSEEHTSELQSLAYLVCRL